MASRKKRFALGVAALVVVDLLIGGSIISVVKSADFALGGGEDIEKNVITTVPIRDNMFLIRGGVANVIVLIEDEGVVIVDTGLIEMTGKIKTAIADLTDKKVAFVINTHAHHDHREGNGLYRAEGAEIIAQEKTRDNIINDRFSPCTELDIPTITFDDAYTFKFGSQEIRITHIPNAHTDGDAIVHFVEADVVATGDMFVHSGLPFISEKYGATIDGYLAGQCALMGHIGEKTIIIPGHGPIADRQDLVETSEALHIVRNRIAALKAKGLSGRYARLLFPTRNTWGFWRENGTGIRDKQFIHIVHRTLPEPTILAALTETKPQDLRD